MTIFLGYRIGLLVKAVERGNIFIPSQDVEILSGGAYPPGFCNLWFKSYFLASSLAFLKVSLRKLRGIIGFRLIRQSETVPIVRFHSEAI